MPSNNYLTEWEDIQLSPEDKVLKDITLSEVQRLNEELGLVIPEEAQEEEFGLWRALNRIIRRLYDNELITKEQSEEIVYTFYEQSVSEKEQALVGLENLLQIKLVEMGYYRQIMASWDFEELVTDLVTLLPEEQKDVFLSTIGQAAGLPYDIKKELETQVAGNPVAEKKLQALLEANRPLQNSTGVSARTLSPADLRAKFNVAPKDVILPDEEKKTP